MLKNAKLVPFSALLNVYHLQCIPSYYLEYYQEPAQANLQFCVFEDDVQVDTLDLDAEFEKDNIAGALFLKNLTASQLIVQEEMDYGPLIIVQGNVTAQNLYLSGCNAFLLGNVHVAQTFLAGIYNHGEIAVQGDIYAEITITNDHMFNHKRIASGFLFSNGDCTDATKQITFDINDVIAKKYIEEIDEEGEYSKLIDDLKRGKSILAGAKPVSALDKIFIKAAESGNKKLNIGYKELENIPEKVATLTTLQDLDISGNKMTDFSPLAKLPQLKKLYLDWLNLTAIPDAVFKMRDLQSLHLYRNQLNALPDALLQLSQLNTLNLSENHFLAFPALLYQLPALSHLYLNYQNDQPPFLIDKTLPHLKTLIINANFGTNITAVQPALEILNLRNCSLARFPEVIFESKQLKSLDFSLNNAIKKIPSELTLFTQLNTIGFSHVVDNVAILASLSKLHTIEISGKVSPKLITEVCELPQWQHLILGDDFWNNDVMKRILKRDNLKSITMKFVKQDIKSLKKELRVD